jgi:hypothetical protein
MNKFLQTSSLKCRKALYSKRFWCGRFIQNIKKALKRERRKEQKRKSLLRTLTANRLMANADIIDTMNTLADKSLARVSFR